MQVNSKFRSCTEMEFEESKNCAHSLNLKTAYSPLREGDWLGKEFEFIGNRLRVVIFVLIAWTSTKKKKEITLIHGFQAYRNDLKNTSTPCRDRAISAWVFWCTFNEIDNNYTYTTNFVIKNAFQVLFMDIHLL